MSLSPRLSRRLALAALPASLLLYNHASFAQAADPRLAAAKAAGKVSWYTSVAPDELRKELIDGFKKKTGLDVVVYYGGTGTVYSRLSTERRTKSYNVDVVTLGDTDLVDELSTANALKKYHSANFAGVQDAYKDKNDHWIGICFYGLTKAVNTEQVKPGAEPQSWAELADPKWKSKVVISDPAKSASGLLLLKAMVKEQGWPWVEKLLRNDPLAIAIAPGIEQVLANGERSVSTAATSFLSETMKAKGPVKPVGEVLFTSPLTASLIAEAPNPKGGELLIDYLTSKEAGESFRKYGWFSSRGDVEGPYGFPSAAKLKVKYATVDLPMTRSQLLEQYGQILQKAKSGS
ncbi:MAG: extracellular solute-binding protein [Pseudomonadota bacterium]